MVTSVDVRELSPSKVDLDVEVATRHVQRAFKNVYRQLSRSGRVPGFRVGRVPPPVLKRYFGEEVIKDAAVAELAPDAVTEAVEQAGIVVIDASPIRDVQIEEGDVLRFTTTVDVRPRPRLGQYKELSLVRPRAEVTEEQAEEGLREMRDSTSAWIETDRTEVRKDDRVFADVTVEVEGEEPMSDTDVGFHVGSGRTQPPIDEGMIGAEVGSTLEIETKYPDDFDDEDLAGKPATATVTIKRLEEHREAELNDEFAKENYGFETLDELRADIRQRLEEAAAEEAENALREQALEKAVEGAHVEIPRRLADEQAQLRLQQLTTDVGQYGMRYEDLLREGKTSHEQMTARIKKSSEETLKRFFVVEAIAEAEGIEVLDEEVEVEVERIAEEENRPAGAVREELEAQDRIEPIRLRLREDKVVALLVESANVTEALAEDQEQESEPEEAGDADDADGEGAAQ
ncbi:MAG: trigger factor [Armatimonadota bacterium]